MVKWFILLTLFLGTNEKEIENKRLEFLNMPFPHRHKLPLFLRYVELCPGQVNLPNQTIYYLSVQRKSSPCNPKNIDKFVQYHINKGDNITDILSKVHNVHYQNVCFGLPISL